MDALNLTFDELVEANVAANRSKAGRDAYNDILAALAKAPQVRERLTFDMIKAAEKFVSESAEPGPLACWIRDWSKYVTGAKLEGFTNLVEDLIIQYCRRVGSFELSTPEITLYVLLSAIRENQPARIDSTLKKPKTSADRLALKSSRGPFRNLKREARKGDRRRGGVKGSPNPFTDLALGNAKKQAHHILGWIRFVVEQDQEQLEFRAGQTALGPGPGRRCRGVPAAVLAARAAYHFTAKRWATSSNSRTVRFVVVGINRSDRFASSREIMLACLPQNRPYYQSPLICMQQPMDKKRLLVKITFFLLLAPLAVFVFVPPIRKYVPPVVLMVNMFALAALAIWAAVAGNNQPR